MKNEQIAGIFYPLAIASFFAPIFFLRPVTNYPLLIICWTIGSVVVFINTSSKNISNRFLLSFLSFLLFMAPIAIVTREDQTLGLAGAFMIILVPIFWIISAILGSIGKVFKNRANAEQPMMSANGSTTTTTTTTKGGVSRTMIFLLIGLALYCSTFVTLPGPLLAITLFAWPLGILFMIIAVIDGILNLFRQ